MKVLIWGCWEIKTQQIRKLGNFSLKYDQTKDMVNKVLSLIWVCL